MRYALLACFVLTLPLITSAAIAVDTNTSGTFTTNLSTSYTTAATANMVMLAAICTTSASAPPTPPTYNGVSLTQIDSQRTISSGIWCDDYILVAPATGANTFAFSGSGVSAYAIYTYSGAAQTGQPSKHGIDTNTTSCSASVTTATVNNLVWGISLSQDQSSFTDGGIGTNQQALNGWTGGGSTSTRFGDQGVVATGAHTVTASGTADSRFSCLAVALEPLATAVNPFFLAYWW